MRMSTGNVFMNVIGFRCSVLVGSDLPHSLIDVRQNSASVRDAVLVDEQLEEP